MADQYVLLRSMKETFNAAGYQTKDITAFLESFGYQAFKIVRRHIVPTDHAGLSAWGNYIFRVKA